SAFIGKIHNHSFRHYQFDYSEIKFLEIQRQLTELQIETAANRAANAVKIDFSQPKLSQFPGTSVTSQGGAASIGGGDYEVILKAIRDQDEQLVKAAESIRDEIRELKRERLQSREKQTTRVAPQLPMIPYQPKNPASQINALKSAYLMAGGHDTNLLRQMNETMGDAMNKHVTRMGGVGYGAEGGQPKSFMGVPKPEMSATEAMRLLEYEKENRLIMQELDLLRYRRSNEEDIVEKVQREHYLKMMNMQHEIDTLRAEAYLKQIKEYLNPPPKPIPPLKENPHLMTPSNPLFSNNYVSLHSQPYDPTAGFVIFYDFLLNIDHTYDKMQLIVSLYNGPHEVCTAKVLPERDCFSQAMPTQQGSVDPVTDSSMKFCLLSISQPVQKCRPGPDLALVVEVQAQSSFLPRQKTIGWAKVLLFDNQLRVLSGRWRTPIRLIPLRADMIVKDLNTVPQ
ncbi:coiled-coil domain-containing protein 17-like, partial [Convolutriloba macropyga]|uniref:coiled-coil domain-containing protein 17-like n=1 Tax=Convolutriloba macropyga TaxID=536237 RepID=UPI003F51FF87